MNHLVVERERENVSFNPEEEVANRLVGSLQGRNLQLPWGNVPPQ